MQIKQYSKVKSKYQEEGLNSIRKKRKTLLGGTIIAVIIIVSPYLFWIHELFPSISIWDSPFGTISSNYYGDVQVLFWMLLNKLVPLLLFCIWFFTCKHWWYHALIIPICTLTFQVYEVVDDETASLGSEFMYVIPLIFVVAIFVYTIRLRVFDKIYGIDYNELSRVNWKGNIVSGSNSPYSYDQEEQEEEEEEDKEPLFMG